MEASRLAVPWPRRSTRRSAERASHVAPLRGLLPVVLLLVFWQIVSSDDALTFPPPTAWYEALEGLASEGGLGDAALLTVRTFVIGLLLAIVVGFTLGAAIGSSRLLDKALSPLMDFFRTLPPPAVVPVIALVVGPSLGSAILIVVIAATWPILLNTAAGMRAIPPVRLEMARSLNLSAFAKVRSVIIPSLAPSVLLGVRVSVSIALIVTLFLEVLGLTEGIGFLLRDSQQAFDSAAVWGLVLTVGIAGYVVNVLVSVGEARALRNWPGGAR